MWRPCSLVEVYRRFRGSCCLDHQGDVGGCKHLWNVGKLLPDYTAQQPRRQSLLKERCSGTEFHNHSGCIRDERSLMFYCDGCEIRVRNWVIVQIKELYEFSSPYSEKRIGNRFCEACYFKLVALSTSSDHKNRVTCCCVVHSISGVAMLNMSRYYHCSRDDDSQVCASDGRFILCIRGILFSAANITFEINGHFLLFSSYIFI
jgi:hypothetical protein